MAFFCLVTLFSQAVYTGRESPESDGGRGRRMDMQKPCFQNSCFKNYQCRCMCTVCFGLGMSLSCFCPTGLTLFLSAAILVALGISLLRH